MADNKNIEPNKKGKESFLEAFNLKKKYKKIPVVNEVNLKVKQGEVVGLLGPNGAGKTTSFYMIIGLIKPTEGRIVLNEKDITSLPVHKRAHLGIGYLPQEASIFRKLTVRENIQAILEFQKLPKKSINERTDQLIEQFEIAHVQNQKGYTLSGGERRRTEIARTLASNPKFILLDEPFAGVDPLVIKEIQNIIKSLKKQNLGVLITDHNVRETLKITDRSYIMFKGSILIEGPAKKLVQDKMAKKIYLGHDFKM